MKQENQKHGPPMSVIEAARKEWEAETTLEEVEFSIFPGKPQIMRRHTLVQGGLAALHFGWNLRNGEWVECKSTVYFGMIMSDVPGDGTKLLSRIKGLVDKYDLTIVGQPTPMKPITWASDRPFSLKQEILEGWYARHGFHVLSEGNNRLVRYPIQDDD